MIRRTGINRVGFRKPSIRRRGMSLTEVLVALFILTLGVIGILTMFPLGAAQMARAVRDDRSALAAANADAYMRWYWQNYVVNGQAGTSIYEPNFAPGTGLFDNPAQFGGVLATLPSLSQTNANQLTYLGANQFPGQLSYPVVVDPMGWSAGRVQYFGEAPYTQIPRCTLQSIAGSNATIPSQPALNGLTAQNQLAVYSYRACSLVDSLGFNENGTPNDDLEMRYNWMWVLQRPMYINEENESNTNPNNATPNRNLLTANMTVVVFDRRPFLYPPPSVKGFESVFSNVTFTSGLTSVSIPLSSADQAVDLKAGSWVMDASIVGTAKPYPIRQANFYRVVSVVQVSSTQVDIELQTPVMPPTGYSPLGQTWTGTLVALRGVSGVFVRPPLTPY